MSKGATDATQIGASRIRELVANKTTPMYWSEQEIAGYHGRQWKSVANGISQIRADGAHVVRFEPLAPHLVGAASRAVPDRGIRRILRDRKRAGKLECLGRGLI